MKKDPVKGVNDCATLFPHLLNEFDIEKNIGKNLNDFLPRSNKKVWWICYSGHSWSAPIYSRTDKMAKGCPYCAGKKAIKGETDLATLRPDLAEEWDYENNEGNPEDYTKCSGEKVHWICKNGHRWETVIANRNKPNGSGCPYCAGKKAIKGETDLVTVRPDLVEEWDYENNKRNPEDYTSCSNQSVNWKCKNGHKWSARIANRVKSNSNCPYCAGQKAIKGETDLATVRPDLAEEWDYEKNEGNPEDYTKCSGKKVHWICKNGHRWEAVIANRNKPDGTNCPYCAGKKAIKGETDLATIRPDLIEEWDYEKNEGKPEEYTGSSSKDVNWKCKNGHKWSARIAHRVKSNSNCPYCAGQKGIKGETDLATVRPDLAEEWDYEKNKGKPEEYASRSGKKVNWICKNGHRWEAVIASRGKAGCPYCSGRKAIIGENDLLTIYAEMIRTEWDYDKNKGIKPEDCTCHSARKVWWRCEKGHSYKQCIRTKVKGVGCKMCR